MRVAEEYEGWVYNGEEWVVVRRLPTECAAMEWAEQTIEPVMVKRYTIIYRDEVRV